MSNKNKNKNFAVTTRYGQIQIWGKNKNEKDY